MNTGQHPNEFKTTLVKQVDIPYLVYLPKEYETKGKMPLLFFLHGSGERGNDPQKLKVHSIPKIIDDRDDFPFIVVSPQCPDGQRWDVEVLNALLDKVIAELPVDSNRIYLTGLSMGGYGVWRFAIAHPDRFAAIAPVCGWGVLEDVEKLRTMPVWVFHGAKDNVVPPSESEKMVERLQKFGNTQVKFTLYPDANHNAWDAAYGTPELYEWFLQHTKKSF
ncbi:MAG: prolyl oligopeptidase family serine peptidase [Bacteroidetes bacterium]|nr:prolyl oligopeptidase family serine peptidase [Bacteroidota bacterium]